MALLNDDYETLLKFTYPNVIALTGGPDKMISLIKKGKIEMQQQGITFDHVVIGKPTAVVKAGNEIHCMVPQTVFIKVPKGKMKSKSHLLAVSKNGGRHWYFIDTVNLTSENIKLVLPNYNFDLAIPPKKKPVFIAD